MLNSKKLLAGLGAVAGLGVAMMPLASVSAVDVTSNTPTGVVRAKIGETLSLTVAESYTDDSSDTVYNGHFVTIGENGKSEELKHTITVKGSTINDYKLTMIGYDGITTLRRVADTTQEVGAAARYDSNTIATGTSIDGETSNWAYKYSADDSTYGSYTAIAAAHNNDNAVLHAPDSTTNTAGYTDLHYVKFGISASKNQLAGVYEGQVEYKAVATSAL